MSTKSVYIKNLPPGTTAAGLADLFWQKLGLQIDPAKCQVFSKGTALIHVYGDAFIAFLNLQMGDTGIVFEKPQAGPKVTIEKFSVELQTGNVNRNGIKILK